jgi:hypothetical protein
MKAKAPHGEHRHHHRHRKRRFHVRPEAEGRGYWRFLGLSSRAGRAGERGMDTEDEAGEGRMTNGSTFWMAALIIACLIVGAWLFAEQFIRTLLGLLPH